MENRSTIWQEMEVAPTVLRNYLKTEFRALLKNPFAEEWIESIASFSSPPMTYYILDKMEAFVG